MAGWPDATSDEIAIYREGFTAGAQAQRSADVIALKRDGRGGAPYWLESQPLVEPP